MTGTETSRAEVIYSFGLMLVIYKYGLSPMLLMEFLSTYNGGKIPIHAIISDEDFFKIRLNLTRVQYNEIAEYINNNLPLS